MNEPSVLTRMRLSCCWGDNLNEKELNEVVDYINHLQRENEQLKVEIECFEKSSERKDYNIVEQQEKIVSLTIERDKYKSIVDKAIKYIEETPIGRILPVHYWQEKDYTEPLLKILKELEEGVNK